MNAIGRTIFRTMIFILAAGLVIGLVYVLSFTSFSTTISSSDGHGQGFRSGENQSTLPEGVDGLPFFEDSDSQSLVEGGGGNGFRGGRGAGLGGGQGLGEGRGPGGGKGEEVSVSHGLTEMGLHIIVIAVLITVVALLDHLIRRSRRVRVTA